MSAEPKFVYGITETGSRFTGGHAGSVSEKIRAALRSTPRLLTAEQVGDRVGSNVGGHLPCLVKQGHVQRVPIDQALRTPTLKEQVADFVARHDGGGFSTSQLAKVLGDDLAPGVSVASLLKPHIEAGTVRPFGQASDGSPRWQCSAARNVGVVTCSGPVDTIETATVEEVVAALTESPTTGRKDDQGKLAMHLLPFDALDEVAGVLAYGAARYGERNWEDGGLSSERLLSGVMRHISAHMQGKRYDDGPGGSGRLHLSNAATSLMMALAKELRSNGSN